jgi:hypothetical protein
VAGTAAGGQEVKAYAPTREGPAWAQCAKTPLAPNRNTLTKQSMLCTSQPQRLWRLEEASDPCIAPPASS